MTIEGQALARLLPHQGAMCLLERVIDWDERHLIAVTDSHRRMDNPLRRAGRLDCVHALEYAAQAMAVHGALREQHEGRSMSGGLLAAGRDLRFAVERLDTLAGPLTVAVTEELAHAGSLAYRFRIDGANATVAEGSAMVMGRRPPAPTA